jgi:hypothetical protein
MDADGQDEGEIRSPTHYPIGWNWGPSVEAKREEGFSHEYAQRLATSNKWRRLG